MNQMKQICLVLAIGFAWTAHAQTPAAAESRISDGQIIKVLLTVNQGEIDAAEMARDKSKNEDVKNFAKMMITQHTQNKEDTKFLAKKDSLAPMESDLSKSISADAKTNNNDVKKSAVFDRSYVEEQVSMHQKALDTLNEVLIPSAHNADLKTHLEKTREDVVVHLTQAKSLQAKLK